MAAVQNLGQTKEYRVLVLEDEVSMNRGIAFAAEKNWETMLPIRCSSKM